MMDDPVREARALARATPVATLATSLVEQSWPYASLTLTACAFDAAPLLLLSRLAEHTRNLAADPRVSLLFDATTGAEEHRLAGTRVTVLGCAARSTDTAEKARFLARHPEAEVYARFSDFGLWRVELERAHLVAGFGRIRWIEGPDLRFDARAAGPLAAAEATLLAEWNADGAAVARLATGVLGLESGPWRITGCDPEGCDLRAGGRTARVPFPAPVVTPEAARSALASFAKTAIGRRVPRPVAFDGNEPEQGNPDLAAPLASAGPEFAARTRLGAQDGETPEAMQDREDSS